MFGKIWNGLFLFGLFAAGFSFLTGKDLLGTPTSAKSAECSDIADQFIGKEMTIDYTLRKIQRVDRMETLARTDSDLTCRGLAYLENSPSTFVRLTASDTSDKQVYFEIGQAKPQDYDCGLLGEEITMKFRDSKVGDYGTVFGITDGQPIPNQPNLTCRGKAMFSSGATLPFTFAFDGEQFSFHP